MTTRIDKIETWACTLPLPHPLDFGGGFVVRNREYAALRVTTSDGLVSDCLSLSRRAPIDVAITDVLAPLLMGTDALDIPASAAGLDAGTRALDGDGVIGRARSLIDICLWDLQAQAKGVPLWKLLGGSARTLDILLVEGYSLPGEDDAGFATRLAQRVEQGFRRLKIEAASYRDPGVLGRRLGRFRALAGDDPEVVLDLAWSWPDAQTGIDAAERWREHGLGWIEDPMRRDRVAEIALLRRGCGVPIAVGDECTRPAELEQLMAAKAIDVLRLDAATIGGVGAALALGARGSAAGLRISLHEHPEIHEHLAFALPDCNHVELFPQDRPFVCSHELLERTTLDRSVRGRLSPPEAPGTGLRLKDAVLARTAYRHQTLSQATGSLPSAGTPDEKVLAATAQRRTSELPERRIVLITGGAKGIGWATAEAFLARGWSVAIGDIDMEGARQREDAQPGCISAVCLDVRDESSVARAFAETVDRMGRLDAVINNAGIQRWTTIAELDWAAWEEVIEVDLKGVLRCMHMASRYLRSGGAIVNIASVVADRGQPGRTPYAAAKAALVSLTRTAAVEWATRNIRVNAVGPGYVDTPLLQAYVQSGRLDISTILDRVPMRRLARAAEIAEVVAFLASDAASFVTGQVVYADGGFLADFGIAARKPE